jgi:inward rectifier potassium channel
VKLPPPRIDLRGLTAVKVGVNRFSLEDPYYFVLAMRWSTFLASVFALYVAVNLIFATLYWAVPGSVANVRAGAFGDAFFFSVETLATVGYGVMTPATLYGHIVATGEIFLGMFLTALVTGAFFARFARPRPRLVFSETAVIAPHEGRQALMIRVASRRLQAISEAKARISCLDSGPLSGRLRRFSELKLFRDTLPVLSLSWTIIHVIDETSPLFGLTPELLAEQEITLMVSITGFDEAISAQINDRKVYRRENLRVGHAFVDILRDLPNGLIELDITRIHDTRPAPAPKTAEESEPQEVAVSAS